MSAGVIGANVARRNMSTGQRAMCTALVLEADGRRENGRWTRKSKGGITQDLGLSEAQAEALRQCGVILDYQRDLAALVADGSMALEAAGRRIDTKSGGRQWKPNSVIGAENTESRIRNTWQDYMRQCGAILDFQRDLAPLVADGSMDP
ncbi:hypothetical protein [Mycobacterium sp. OTB74]|jgi:hypothetical protein|uniref:hypothetical protein n=1 Tax=Mycobacterium sp. OTB74 TaxID=1853452 RepID=UPI00247665D2|nr:hypothetical protein [Mycobacterium sp. OTB74]MDH6245170.1 hypothetical protein [Mycobacterium sp. OTB74]